MKKLTTLLMICSLFVITTIVFASEKPGMNDDGVKWTPDKGDTYINDKSITRTGYTLDDNGIKDQEASVRIAAKAYIPCYLKLELTGNQGKTTAESFGPGAKATGDASGYEMVFDNEIGGFVDSNWNVKATGKKAEISPDEGYNIAACDTFKVVVYSNDNFEYDVISAPLINSDKKKSLNLIMGTSTDNKSFSPYTFDGINNNTKIIATGGPCDTITRYHKFAVPYTKATAQGEYTGNVTFKAYTL